MAIDLIEWLWIEQNCYQLKRLAINRTDGLSIEQNSYRENITAISRKEWLSIELMVIDRTEWL